MDTINIAQLRPSGRSALRIAARHLNTPLARTIDEGTILSWLRQATWGNQDEAHARALLAETDPVTFLDLVLAGAVTYAQLHACSTLLLADNHPTRLWLAERANG